MALPRPKPDVAALKRRVRTGVGLIALGFAQASGAALTLAWIGVKRTLGVALAFILLFEQWGWRPLAAVLAVAARLAPIAALERAIGRLPPYGALIVFTAPVALLVPLKVAALVLIAKGHTLSAAGVFIGAKVIGTAIVARLYHLTGPQLMQIDWVREAHGVVAPRLQALHDEIRASWAWRYGRLVKAGTKRAIRPVLVRLKGPLLAAMAGGTGKA